MITVYIGKPNKNIQGENFSLNKETLQGFFDMATSPSLFGDTKTIILKNPFEDEEVKKTLLEQLKYSDGWVHDVVMVCDTLLAADIKKIEKYVTIHKNTTKEKKEESFNPFTLAHVFAAGDKKNTWITFHQVTSRDDEIEKTHGMIWWKLKDMMQKNKMNHDAYKKMARELVCMYHESRLGGNNLKDRLEKFFLTLNY